MEKLYRYVYNVYTMGPAEKSMIYYQYRVLFVTTPSIESATLHILARANAKKKTFSKPDFKSCRCIIFLLADAFL